MALATTLFEYFLHFASINSSMIRIKRTIEINNEPNATEPR